MKYKVVLDDEGKKDLEVIETYDDWINDKPEEDTNIVIKIIN